MAKELQTVQIMIYLSQFAGVTKLGTNYKRFVLLEHYSRLQT